MKVTKHFQSRMSQRAIRRDLIELALTFGEPLGDDRVIFSRDSASSLIEELDYLRRKALRMLDKGGIVLAIKRDKLITGFRIESFSSRKALKSRPDY